MRHFQDTFETRKPSFVSAFSIRMAVPLKFTRHSILYYLPKAELILAIYCVRYPHAVPFLWNKIPYSLLKTPKTHAV